ncbi:MAG: hypothetical protein ABR512_11080 [Desulfopila sp.]
MMQRHTIQCADSGKSGKSGKQQQNSGILYGAVACSILAVLVLLCLPLNAAAGNDRQRERFILNFGDSHIRGGRGEVAPIFLKKAMQRQYPRVNVSQYRLKKVVLVAKTQHGRGGAQLRVGPKVTGFHGVGGHPRGFNKNHRKSFDRVGIHNPFNQSYGPWQLLLKGNFKVRKVALVVEERHTNRYGGYRDRVVPRHYYGRPGNHRLPRQQEFHQGRIFVKMRW